MDAVSQSQSPRKDANKPIYKRKSTKDAPKDAVPIYPEPAGDPSY